MHVELTADIRVNIADMTPDEAMHLVNMIRSADLEDSRVFHPILRQLTETPFNELPTANDHTFR